MKKKALTKDEAQILATNYVQNKLNLADIKIEGDKITEIGGVLVFKFYWKARKHAMSIDGFDAVIG